MTLAVASMTTTMARNSKNPIINPFIQVSDYRIHLRPYLMCIGTAGALEQFSTLQVLKSEQSAFQMGPPDSRPQFRGPLPHRNEEIAYSGETVIIPACVPVIPNNTVGEELGMIPSEEYLLQTRAAFWIPMQGHHIRQVHGAQPHRPSIPVNETYG